MINTVITWFSPSPLAYFHQPAIRIDRVHSDFVFGDFKLSAALCAKILTLANTSYRSAPTLNTLDLFSLKLNFRISRLNISTHRFTFSLNFSCSLSIVTSKSFRIYPVLRLYYFSPSLLLRCYLLFVTVYIFLFFSFLGINFQLDRAILYYFPDNLQE